MDSQSGFFRILIFSVGLMAVAIVGFIVAGRAVIRLWAGPEVTPAWPFLLAMCLYFFIRAGLGATGVILVNWASSSRALHFTSLARLFSSVLHGGSRHGLASVPFPLPGPQLSPG